MSTKMSMKSLPYHKETSSASNENQMTMRHMSNRILPIKFPPTKTVLWDSTPMGDAIGLHFSYYRNPRLLLSEKALRLAYRHAKPERRDFYCFLLGSFSVDDDEEGVTLTIDRFDPGQVKPSSAGKVPAALLPGDVIISCTVSTGESAGNVTLHNPEEFALTFKGLQSHLHCKESLDLSKLLAVRAYITYSENMDNLHFDLRWAAVTVANTFESVPIKPVPIIPTALARNLSSHHNIAQLQGTHKWGYLTMDQTRKLLLILESEPKAYTLPLVGIWLSGITHIHSPQVWLSCLRYLFSSSIKERVLSESGSFLIVLYSLTHKEPEFYECIPCVGNDPLGFQLLTCEDSLHLFKNVDSSKQSHVQFELTTDCHNSEAYLFSEVSKTVSAIAPKQNASPSKLSVSDHDSGVEDEDFSPRPSPRPHPSFQQATRIHPSVPELSLVFGSAVEPKPAMKNSGNCIKQALPLSSTPKVGNPFTVTSHPHNDSHGKESVPKPSSVCKTIKPQVMKPSRGKSSTGDKPSAHCHPNGQTRRSSTSSTSSSSLSTPRTGSSPDTSVHQVRGSSELDLRCNMNGPCQEQPPFTPSPYFRPSSLPQSSNHNATFPLQARPLCEATKTAQRFTPCRHQATVCNCYNTIGLAQCISPTSWPAVGNIGHQSLESPSQPHAGTVPFYQNICPNACCSPILMNASQMGESTPPAHGSNSTARRNSLPINTCCNKPCIHMAPLTMPGPSTMLGLSAEAYQLLAEQDQQLKLLQAQIQRLLDVQASQANSKAAAESVATETEIMEPAKKSCVSIAVSTGASLFWNPPPCPEEEESLDKPDESELCNELRAAVSNEQDVSGSTIASSLKAVDMYSFAESSQLTDCTGQSPPSLRPVCSVRDEVSQLPHDSGLSTNGSVSDAFPEYPGNSKTTDLGTSVPNLPPEKFYQDLLNQVNHLLKTSSCASSEANESHSRAESRAGESLTEKTKEYSSQDTSQIDSDRVQKATLKQLKSLGVEMTADTSAMKLNGSDTAENACVLACINPEAVIPRLNYMSFTNIGLSGFVPSGVDLSMEANAIALKYLSESQLSQLSLSHANQNKALDDSIPGTSEKSMVGLSLISPNNLSFATKKYLKRYALIESNDSSDDDSDPPPNTDLAFSEQAGKNRTDYSGKSDDKLSLDFISAPKPDPTDKAAVEFINHTEVKTLRNITNEMPKRGFPARLTGEEASLNFLKDLLPKPKLTTGKVPFMGHHDKENERNSPLFNAKDSNSSAKKVAASSLEVLDVNHLRQLPKLF